MAAQSDARFCKKCGSPIERDEVVGEPDVPDTEPAAAPPVSDRKELADFNSIFASAYEKADSLAGRDLGPLSSAAGWVAGLRAESPAKQAVVWAAGLLVFALLFMGGLAAVPAIKEAIDESSKMSCEEYLDEVYLANEATGRPGPPSEIRAADDRYFELVMQVDEYCDVPEDE